MSREKHSAAFAATESTDHAASAALVKFDFHGDELDVVTTQDGEHWVALPRLCEPLGLLHHGQAAKLKSLDWACTQIICVHDASGRKQEIVCLNIRSVAGWLFTINAGKVATHLRDKLALYQRECAEVLADHFLGKRIEAAEINDQGERTRDFFAGLYMQLDARLSQLSTQVTAIAAGSGVISYEQDIGIKGEIESLANMRVLLGYNKTLRGAMTSLNQRVSSAAEWGGTGARRASMPADRLPRVKVCLQNIRADLEAEARRRKVNPRGAASVHILKKALQENLFEKKPN